MTASHLEIERTYDLPENSALPDLVGVVGVVRTEQLEPFELDATYWDTDQYDLVAAHCTVRRRTGGSDAGWHIKRAASDTHRHEQHFPLTDDPDAAPPALLDAIFVERRGRSLGPIVRITTQRTITRLLDAAGEQIAELADDHVTAARLDAGAPDSPRRWHEIEVELTGISPDTADAAIRALDARFAAVGAEPAAVSSKLARGLQGAAVPRLRTADKPEKGTTARVLRKRLRPLQAALVAQAQRITAGDHADTAAIAAAAVRTSALLTVYRPAFPATGAWEAGVAAASELADLAARAERSERLARNLHVAGAPGADALVPSATRSRIRAASARRRTADVRTLERFVRSEPFVHLLDRLDEAVERPDPTPWALRSPKKVAQDITGTWKHRAQEAVRNAVGDGTDQLDDLHGTESAWADTMRLRLAMEALGDDAYPHSLLRRVTAAADVLTVRAQALAALAELRRLAVGERVDVTESFGFGVLAAERAREADEAHELAMRALGHG